MHINKYNEIFIIIPILFDNILQLLLQDHNCVSFAQAFISWGLYKPFDRQAHQTVRSPGRNGPDVGQRCEVSISTAIECSHL